MKAAGVNLVLLLVGAAHGLAAKGSPSTADLTQGVVKELEISPQNTYGDWINPEDLPAMPQCIAQQDQSAWLSAMTACTGKICTRHFGFICSHHQYLTQLSCLRTGFSPDLIRGYLPYCGRSVLAKAQLYEWVLQITGRTWLVNVGDALEVQRLSPASLREGYVSVDVAHKAPTCLLSADSEPSKESLQHIMASCGFTSITEHTGNAARPWEYNQGLQSMTALDYETAGYYTLTQHYIPFEDYFDKACFCKTFKLDAVHEPCLAMQELDVTKERLWMNATCGPKSLPSNWTENLQITGAAYIPTRDWTWPACVADVPRQVLRLTHSCAADACDLDSSGYCKVTPAVERACFCRGVNYDSCKGSCHNFENRIDYVKWMHHLCGDVEHWHGLPKDWRKLAAPTAEDMIPWQWSMVPSKRSSEKGSTCASSNNMLTSLILLNAATLLAALFIQSTPDQSQPLNWIVAGLSSAAIQVFAYWSSAYLIQSAPGFSHIPVTQLVLLLCTIPRPVWLKAAFFTLKPPETAGLRTAASMMCGEAILQVLAVYYMLMTLRYGLAHAFYNDSMSKLNNAPEARLMYIGAALWCAISLVALVQCIRVACQEVKSTDSGAAKTDQGALANLSSQLNARFDPLNNLYVQQETALARRWAAQGRDAHLALLARAQPAYGTVTIVRFEDVRIKRAYIGVYVVALLSLLGTWIAQSLFWVGFLGLSMGRFCVPFLGAVTAVWIVGSLVGDVVAGRCMGRG